MIVSNLFCKSFLSEIEIFIGMISPELRGNMKKLQNSWEYWDCDRELGGKNTSSGICKAAVDEHFDGINGGKCAGQSFCAR
jgi:hypothetical protein